MSTQKKRVLVTGGSGFLGWLVANSLSRDYEVAYSYAQHPVDVPNAHTFHMDFTKPETILFCVRTFRPDAVVHTAAMTGAGECEAERDRAVAVNVTGVERLIESLAIRDFFFIYLSTDMLFDGKTPPYSESSIPAPVNFYGETKRRGEETVRRMWDNHVILRVALMFGPTNPAGRGSFLKWMDDTLRGGRPLTLFEDEFRTPVYGPDVAEAIRCLLNDPPPQCLYHLGGPERISRLDFGLRFAAIRGYDPGLIRALKQNASDTGSQRAPDVSLDSSLIQSDLGLTLTPIDDALRSISGQ